MKIRKNDTVIIISGKDRAKRGKVLQVFPQRGRALVEGVNLRKKHQRPKRSGEKGQVVEIPGSLNISNLKLVCPKCGKPTRIGFKIAGDKKYRACKKCGQEI